MTEAQYLAAVVVLLAVYSWVYFAFLQNLGADPVTRSHDATTVPGGRSVDKRWSGRGQRPIDPSDHSRGQTAVHPCPRLINAVPPQAESSTRAAGCME